MEGGTFVQEEAQDVAVGKREGLVDIVALAACCV